MAARRVVSIVGIAAVLCGALIAPAPAGAVAPVAPGITFEGGAHFNVEDALESHEDSVTTCTSGETNCPLNEAYVRDTMDKLKAAGFEWVRMALLWRLVEKDGPRTNDPNAYMQSFEKALDIAAEPRTVGGIQHPGLKVLVNVIDTPDWARDCTHGMPQCGLKSDNERPLASGSAGTYSWSNYGSFTRFVEWGLRYFKSDGSGAVSAFEVWNEPNELQFWAQCTTTDAVKYLTGCPGTAGIAPDDEIGYDATDIDEAAVDAFAALVRATYDRINATGSDLANVTVVTGGLNFARPLSVTWFKRAYDGFQGKFDAVGIHPYSAPRDDPPYGDASTHESGAYFGQLAAIHDVVQSSGVDKPLWITEVGNSHLDGQPQADSSSYKRVDDATSAEYFYQRYRRISCELPYVEKTFHYAARDRLKVPAPQTSSEWAGDVYEDSFGLMTEDGTTRPVYATAKSLHASGTTPDGRALTCTNGRYVPLAPEERIFNSVHEGGALSAGATRDVAITRGSVPDEGVSAVLLRVIAHAQTGSGTLVVHPFRDTGSSTSVVNYKSTSTAPSKYTSNVIVAKPGYEKKVTIRNAAGATTHIALDVLGYYTDGSGAASGGLYRPATGHRVYDSRTTTSGAVPAGGQVTVPVTGQLGVSATEVGAVALNVTSVPVSGTSNGGYLRVSKPGSSALNTQAYEPGKVLATSTVVPVSTDGKVTVLNDSAGPRHVVLDVQGWWTKTSSASTAIQGGTMLQLTPRRIYDSRPVSTGVAPNGSVQINLSRKMVYSPRTVVSGAAAYVNVTIVTGGSSGYLRIYPAGTVPLTPPSNLNFGPNEIKANSVAVPVAPGGDIVIEHVTSSAPTSAEPVHVIVDGFGWMTGP